MYTAIVTMRLESSESVSVTVNNFEYPLIVNTEEGYEIGSYGLFAKTKKAALGAARIIDHTSPYRIIIQDMEPKTYHMLNGEDGCSTEDEDELQTSLKEFYSHQSVDP